MADLNDGRLLMMIRTHWGHFWEALSDDGGLWVIAGFAFTKGDWLEPLPLRLKLDEETFFNEAKKSS